ncbi:recombinase family protein [Thomasclavelia cocleata]|uniref:Site-specific DNA recombinase n=1 Tax=Thomasclavelia cocleata TaxID=69824 RepID=A0A1I0GU32_9FIRM|nr:recombinase family protein [Thomasclavelia cocleata]MCR1961735.1 recombinase family protein [Thomasclavelia cocleata]NDO43360.1 recombinase family protein [Thomasclavelia cocleata]PJN80606.1 recombinase family protein [Thomasclavelia cocleata]SET74877.1 Site-specific DNA recombinase [Thomasclavelia cocleata]
MKESKKNQKNNTKVGIYIRVSTQEQVIHGYSIGAQTDRLKKYCEVMGWDIYKLYIDEGISGKNMKDRPEMQNLLHDIENEKVNNVLVLKVDRLTRSVRDLVDFVDLINEKDCQFTSIMEMIDTSTATGRMFLKIIGIFAEFERENTIERVEIANSRKVSEGYCLYSCTTAWGYDRKKGKKEIYVNHKEAKILKEMEHMFLVDDYSCHKIAFKLNVRGIKTKQGEGNYWTSKAVKYVLTNPVYHGMTRHHTDDLTRYTEHKGKHKPLRTKETYDKIIEKFEQVKHYTKTKHGNENNYFLGALYCSICGSRLNSHIKIKTLANGERKKYTSYRCPNKGMGIGLCNAKSIAHSKMEEAFVNYIKEYEIKINEKIIDQVEIKQQEETNLLNTIKEDLEKQLKKLDRKEEEVMRLYIKNDVDFVTFHQIKKELGIQRDQIITEMESICEETEEEMIQISKKDIITNLRENWELFSDNEKNNFLKKFIHKIHVINKPQENTFYGKAVIEEIIFNEEVTNNKKDE